MPVLRRKGIALHYEVYGEGPPLLLTHGYSATGQMWEGQIAALSRTHQLILWDMRGHGRSDYPTDPEEYSEAATVADMAAILDAVGAPRAVVGGLSLGGYMSLAFYLRYPERVAALLIIDTGPGFKKDTARAQWNETALATARDFEQRGLARLQQATPEMRTSTHRDARGLILAARGMLTQRDDRVISHLPAISVPALVVVGAEDTPFFAAADYMANKIPGAKRVVIPGAGHAVNIDQPHAFNAAVTDFLTAIEGR